MTKRKPKRYGKTILGLTALAVLAAISLFIFFGCAYKPITIYMDGGRPPHRGERNAAPPPSIQSCPKDCASLAPNFDGCLCITPTAFEVKSPKGGHTP